MENNGSNKNGSNRNKMGIPFIIFVTLITALLVMALSKLQNQGGQKEISYNQFQADKIVITAKKQAGDPEAKKYYTGVVKDDTLSERLYKAGIKYEQKIPDTTSSVIIQTLFSFVPLLLLLLMLGWMTRRAEA